jgi:RTA1 like protein
MIQPVPGSRYIYAPTKGVPIAFAILFAISGVLHLWQNNLKFKSWKIGVLLPWAALVFVAGFATREYGAYHYDDLDIFIASTVLLFVAPPVYNGANYFIFGRALYYLPYLSVIHPGRVWTTFVTLDAIDGIIAGIGASYAVNAKNSASARRTGVVLVKVSLFLLIGMFLCFVYLVIHFHMAAKKAGVFNHKMKVIIYELYLSNFLILFRNCFRTAAFFYSWDSVANGKEWAFYIFEVVPMLFNTYLLNIYPPAKYLPPNHKIYLAVDGKTEMEGPGMVDTRPFLSSLIDPFDIAGLVTGSDNKNRFWLTDGIGGQEGPGAQTTRNPHQTPKTTATAEEGEIRH